MENKTDNKLKSVAKKLEELIPEGNAQTVYDKLREIMSSQKEYFQTYSALSVLKLTIYIYSFKKTKNFDLADSIMNKLFFTSLFATENNLYKETCDNCDGGGTETCDDCDGTGNVTCNNCDGGGTETCETCDGNGTAECGTCGGSGEDDEGETCSNCSGEGTETCDDCSGKGKTTCYNCDSDGEVICNNCSGDGSFNCENCDGIGEIETDKIEYDIYELCSWDNNLYNILESKLDKDEPAISDKNLTKFNKSFIILNTVEEYDEFNIELEENMYYCFGVNKIDEIDLDTDIQLMHLSRNKFNIQLNDYIGNYIA